MIASSEVLRRRLEAVLSQAEQLDSPERIVNLEPAAQSLALTRNWDMRRQVRRLLDDINDKNRLDNFSGKMWTDVAFAVGELYEAMRRYDWLINEFYVQTQNNVAHCITAVRSAEAKRLRELNPRPDL